MVPLTYPLFIFQTTRTKTWRYTHSRIFDALTTGLTSSHSLLNVDDQIAVISSNC
jgi:hypothetical protein